MTHIIEGRPVADAITEDVADAVTNLREQGLTPTLATVLASDDPAQERFVALKHDACDRVGIATRPVTVDPGASTERVREAVARVGDDPAVDAVFVQWPLPAHVDELAVRSAVDPSKDVDCLHPESLGRLVAGDPTFEPATAWAVRALLDHAGVSVAGADVTVVGRSPVIGLPIALVLLHADATVTVCHSRTADLGAKTRRADVVVTACGVPELVDGSMLAEGATVVDVSATRVPADTDRGYAVVGDVEFASAEPVVDAITPVPGGVGPVTLAALLRNVVTAAQRRARSG